MRAKDDPYGLNAQCTGCRHVWEYGFEEACPNCGRVKPFQFVNEDRASKRKRGYNKQQDAPMRSA